jgi:hypothetical protein
MRAPGTEADIGAMQGLQGQSRRLPESQWQDFK